MIKFIDTAFVGGVQFRAGMVAEFDIVTELQLIAAGDAVTMPVARIVGQSYAGWSRTSANTSADNTTKVTLASVVVPAGLMGPNSVLRITLDWSYPSSASTKNLMADWGGVNISLGTATTGTGYKGLIEIANKNSLAIQAIQNNTTYGSASRVADQTLDTSQNVTLDFRCSWGAAASAETIILIGYSVWHYPGS
jgi:hypothetical protein